MILTGAIDRRFPSTAAADAALEQESAHVADAAPVCFPRSKSCRLMQVSALVSWALQA